MRPCTICGADVDTIGPEGMVCLRGHRTPREAMKRGAGQVSGPIRQDHEGQEHHRRNGNGNTPHKDVIVTVPPVHFTGKPKPEPRTWLVGSFVPEGLPVPLYGAGGSTRSYLALAMGLCVASRTPRIGGAVERRPVAYLDFEFDEREQHLGALALSRGMGLPDVPEGFAYFPFVGHPFERVRANVQDWLSEHRGDSWC